MGRLQMKNVKEMGGLLYFRRKVAGKDTYQRLPALDDPDFAERYAELARDYTKSGRGEGTFAALVATARASDTFWEGTKASTRANQSRYLATIESDDPTEAGALGRRSVKGMKNHHVFALREKMADRPGVWNNYLTVLKKLMVYAKASGMRETNPCEDIKRFATGEYLPWPDHVIEAALEQGTPMTRLAIITLLCTGQRIGDTIRIQTAWIKDGTLEMTQQKRGKNVFVPDHPMWREAREAMPRGSVLATTVLWDRFGKPFASAGTLRERINDLMKKISPDYRFHPHGLRKNATCYLAEIGLTPHQIGAITGMSAEMVEHYTRNINNRRVVAKVHHLVTGGKFLEARG